MQKFLKYLVFVIKILISCQSLTILIENNGNSFMWKIFLYPETILYFNTGNTG